MSEHQLRQLPKAAMLGSDDAVRLMVALGWPIAARGGDIDCSALNWAVFRANVELTRFLLEHGASWREPHRYGGDVVSLLSWASLYRAGPNRDWAGCAEALLAHGLPKAHLLPKQSESDVYRRVLIDGREIEFPDEVIDVLVE